MSGDYVGAIVLAIIIVLLTIGGVAAFRKDPNR